MKFLTVANAVTELERLRWTCSVVKKEKKKEGNNLKKKMTDKHLGFCDVVP